MKEKKKIQTKEKIQIRKLNGIFCKKKSNKIKKRKNMNKKYK